MARALMLFACLAACGSSTSSPVPLETTLHVESLGQPVNAARVWTTALAPNRRGGWNLILQTYEYQSESPTEFVVLDLASGKSTIDEGPAGAYANSNYQIDEQLRASNGRIFFPELGNRLAYYDPGDERVHQLPPVLDPSGGDKTFFRVVFGPDGHLYAGTQSNGLPAIVTIDPDTLSVRLVGRVGERRLTYSYAYYLTVEPPWIYVAVGENPWELAALDMRNGKSRVLATRDGSGFMQLDAHEDGTTATLISALRTPQQQSVRMRCIDGALRDVTTESETRKRVAIPLPRQISNPPELDLRSAVPDSHGVGRVRWRARGSSWNTVTFRVAHTAAVPIDSLTGLPDGSLLGSVQQYHGLFRYWPATSKIESYGDFGLSGGPRLLVDGQVYMSGYPNSPLWAFDLRAPWGSGNPKLLGAFTDAATHYAYFLRGGLKNRVYFVGRRERDGFGSGIGYYDVNAKTFVGHHRGLESLDPRGLEISDDRVVFSGQLRSDGVAQSGGPTEAQLVVFDESLREVERLTVKPGLQNTGELFASGASSVVLGVIRSPRGTSLYRYDLRRRKLITWKDFPTMGPVASDPEDHSLWAIRDRQLVRIAPNDLRVDVVGTMPESATTEDVLLRAPGHLYWASGGQLRDVRVP